eukprot:6202856-Pleurochrysis_carterae.AAC.4
MSTLPSTPHRRPLGGHKPPNLAQLLTMSFVEGGRAGRDVHALRDVMACLAHDRVPRDTLSMPSAFVPTPTALA